LLAPLPHPYPPDGFYTVLQTRAFMIDKWVGSEGNSCFYVQQVLRQCEVRSPSPRPLGNAFFPYGSLKPFNLPPYAPLRHQISVKLFKNSQDVFTLSVQFGIIPPLPLRPTFFPLACIFPFESASQSLRIPGPFPARPSVQTKRKIPTSPPFCHNWSQFPCYSAVFLILTSRV